MAYFYRLMVGALAVSVFFAAMLPNFAIASIPAESVCQVYDQSHPGYVGSASSCQAAAEAVKAYGVANNYYAGWVPVNCSGPGSCDLNGNPLTATLANQCPPNSSPVGGACVCSSGFVESGLACVSDTQAIINSLNSLGLPLVADGPPGLVVCFAGVVVYATGSAGNSTNKDTEYYGPFSTKNEPCTNEQPAQTTTCKAGESKGSLNGVEICAPDASKTNTVAAGPKTTSSGVGGGDGRDIPGAPEGTKSTETTTSCIGESCKTTTVFKNGAGESLGSTAKTEPKTTFCQDNPQASICLKGSFAGSCGATPSCSGDAVMCAVAAATFATNCSLNPAAGQESALYDSSKGLTGSQVDSLPGSTTVAINSGLFNQTELLGAAQGLSDFQITVMGTTATISMSTLNVWLARLGIILQAISLMIAARIVVRG